MPGRAKRRRLSAVWFADVVGFTTLSGEDEDLAMEVAAELRSVSRVAAAEQGGRVVKDLGDGVLAEFGSADAAVRAALTLQERFGLTGSPSFGSQLRIGVHIGEVVDAEGDILGAGVNTAARIEARSMPGAVTVSGAVRQLLNQQADLSFEPLGGAALKGVAEPVELYEVRLREGVVESSAPSRRIRGSVAAHWPRIAIGTLAVGATGAVALGRANEVGLQSFVSAWIAATIGIWFLFDKAEVSVSPEVRASMSAYLRSAQVDSIMADLPRQFIAVFDRVFGEKHLSLSCFLRSSAASIGAIAVFIPPTLSGEHWGASNVPDAVAWLVVLAGMSWLVFRALRGVGGRTLGLVGGGLLWVLAWVFRVSLSQNPMTLTAPAISAALTIAFLNLPADYLSLLVTRRLLERAARARTLAATIKVLTLDAVLTPIVWLAWVGFFVAVVPVSPGAAGEIATSEAAATIHLLIALLASTFFTSIWLWLYAGGALLSRLFVGVEGGLGRVLRVTDVERQPFRSLGFVCVLIMTGVFLAALPLMML